MHFIRGEYLSGILKKIFLIQNMRNMTHPFFHDASILVSVGVFLTHRFETVGVFAHFLCVKNAKTPSIWSSALASGTRLPASPVRNGSGCGIMFLL